MFDINQNTWDYMSIVVTHRCNMDHAFCVDQYRGESQDISLAHVKTALRFASGEGVRDILLVGGEPTLHPDIFEIVGIAKNHGLRVILTTNYKDRQVVERLDGIVDCFNISWYGQSELTSLLNFVSDITVHALIFQGQLDTQQRLDNFIEEHCTLGHLKFSTLVPCNDYAKSVQAVPYLDTLDCEWVVLFNEILGQVYRGTIIKRYDRIINHNARQSYKCHVDGTISMSWTK